jgi:hypothetical protein
MTCIPALVRETAEVEEHTWFWRRTQYTVDTLNPTAPSGGEP